MKKYLRELEMAGLILVIIGIVLSIFFGVNYGAGPCGVGLLLWLATFLFKAFHWNEYERENRQNIIILTIAILLLILRMMFR